MTDRRRGDIEFKHCYVLPLFTIHYSLGFIHCLIYKIQIMQPEDNLENAEALVASRHPNRSEYRWLGIVGGQN